MFLSLSILCLVGGGLVITSLDRGFAGLSRFQVKPVTYFLFYTALLAFIAFLTYKQSDTGVKRKLEKLVQRTDFGTATVPVKDKKPAYSGFVRAFVAATLAVVLIGAAIIAYTEVELPVSVESSNIQRRLNEQLIVAQNAITTLWNGQNTEQQAQVKAQLPRLQKGLSELPVHAEHPIGQQAALSNQLLQNVDRGAGEVQSATKHPGAGGLTSTNLRELHQLQTELEALQLEGAALQEQQAREAQPNTLGP